MYIIQRRENAKRNKKIGNYIDWNKRDVSNYNPKMIQEQQQQRDLISVKAKKIHVEKENSETKTPLMKPIMPAMRYNNNNPEKIKQR